MGREAIGNGRKKLEKKKKGGKKEVEERGEKEGKKRDGKKWALQVIEPVPGLLKSRENEKKGSLQNRTYA